MSIVRNISGGPLELASGRIIPPTGAGVPDVVDVDVAAGHNAALVDAGLLAVVTAGAPVPAGPQLVDLRALLNNPQANDGLSFDEDLGVFVNRPLPVEGVSSDEIVAVKAASLAVSTWDGSAYSARPTGFAYVVFRGPADPGPSGLDLMQDGDWWENTA